MKVSAILAGAGAGLRLGGAPEGKLWLPLAGRPLVLHSLATLQACESVERIYLVVHARDMVRVESELMTRAELTKLAVPVEGGEERQDSILHALRDLPREAAAVLVHDVARPLLTGDLVRRVAQALELADGVVPALPLTDTVKEVVDGWVVRTWDRDKFYSVQTPQGFKLAALRDAHDRAARDGFRGTDDAALLEHYRYTVVAVPGDRMNIKVTFPEDIAVAEALLATRGN